MASSWCDESLKLKIRACSRKKEARNLGFRGPRSHWRNPILLNRENRIELFRGHTCSRLFRKPDFDFSELSRCVMMCDRTWSMWSLRVHVSVDLITNAHHVNYVGRYRASHASQSLFETSLGLISQKACREKNVYLSFFSRHGFWRGNLVFTRPLSRETNFPEQTCFFCCRMKSILFYLADVACGKFFLEQALRFFFSNWDKNWERACPSK
jgi:hypothetical protein